MNGLDLKEWCDLLDGLPGVRQAFCAPGRQVRYEVKDVDGFSGVLVLMALDDGTLRCLWDIRKHWDSDAVQLHVVDLVPAEKIPEPLHAVLQAALHRQWWVRKEILGNF